MIENYKIVTLCGSTRFKEQFLEAQKRLTLDGCIVISVGLFGHSGDEEVWKAGTKEMLDDMHLRKIDLADEIFVINKGRIEQIDTPENIYRHPNTLFVADFIGEANIIEAEIKENTSEYAQVSIQKKICF